MKEFDAKPFLKLLAELAAKRNGAKIEVEVVEKDETAEERKIKEAV